MSPAPQWLVRLDRAVDYGELHEIFQMIKADAAATRVPEELAEHIDEAIHQLLKERARDQQELAGAESAYQEFKGQQSGVVGWFKRHLPFTETRREELQHRGTVAEQSAEIVADNLMIARATMIKEKLLPATQRKLGHPSSAWHQRLGDRGIDDRPADYGQILRELSVEMQRSHDYLQEVDQAIDAFSRAVFGTKEDQQRRDTDIAAARAELTALQTEVAEKKQLRQVHLRRAGELVLAELMRSDTKFRTDDQRLARLRELTPRFGEASAAVQELLGSVRELNQLLDERAKIPTQFGEIERQLQEAQREHQAAREAADRLDRSSQQQREVREAAVREAERAQQAFTMAERMYKAHYGGTVPAEQPDPSMQTLVDREFQQAEAALDVAQRRLKEISGPYEQARQEHERAAATVKNSQQKLDGCEQQRRTLEERQRKLLPEISALENRLKRSFSTTQSACSTLANQAHNAGFDLAWRLGDASATARGLLGPHGPGDRLLNAVIGTGADQRQHGQAAIDQLLKWLSGDAQRCDTEAKQLEERRRSSWQVRCGALFGDDLARDVAAEFNP